MKKQLLLAHGRVLAKAGLISALSMCFCIAKAQLTYTQVTSGLGTVTFEGGETEFEAGDVDGDGDLDLVSIGDHGSPNVNVTEAGVMVWKNNGTGTNWSLVKSGNLGYGGVALGDVNGDGKMDIGMGMHHNYATSGMGSGAYLIDVGTGDGSGTSWTPYHNGLDTAGTGMNWGMFGTDFGDVNNDGKLDIASVSFGCCDGLWIYKNNGNGSWTNTDAGPTGNSVNSAYCMFGDFNNDGNTDLAVATQAGNIYKNNGQGSFSSMATGLPSDWTAKLSVHPADVNGDGGMDIAYITPGSGPGGQVFVYTYDKATSKWVSISTGLPPASKAVFGAALADMDMDGKCDLVAWTATQIEIYKGDGAGNWTLNGTIPNTISTSYGFRAAAVGDFDHDGFTDIASFCNTGGSNSLKVFLHTVGTTTLNIVPQFPHGSECFVAGSVQFVKWLSSVPSTGPNATTTIEFSSTGSAGPWTNVVTSAPNSGVYQWVTPAVSSPNCCLRLTVSQGSSSQSVITAPFGVGSCTATGVNETTEIMNDLQIFPNPTSTVATIEFNLATSSVVEINIVDMLGRNILNVAKENMSAGNHKVSVPAAQLNSGIYFCEVKAGNSTMQGKIVISK